MKTSTLLPFSCTPEASLVPRFSKRMVVDRVLQVVADPISKGGIRSGVITLLKKHCPQRLYKKEGEKLYLACRENVCKFK